MFRKNKSFPELVADRKRRSLSTVYLRTEEAEQLVELLKALNATSIREALERVSSDLAKPAM